MSQMGKKNEVKKWELWSEKKIKYSMHLGF